MKVLPAGLLWLVVAAAALSLQSPTSSAAQTSTPARAVVAGLVAKDPGSEPVKKALIELIAESQSDGGNYTALTGVDGGFRIENIVPGRYHLFAERSGFQEVDRHQRRSEGRVLTLAAGQELKDLVIRLQAAAVVEGRVTDKPIGPNGFGYDPVFFYEPFGCTFGEAAPEQKMMVSHRAKALQQMFTFLRSASI